MGQLCANDLLREIDRWQRAPWAELATEATEQGLEVTEQVERQELEAREPIGADLAKSVHGWCGWVPWEQRFWRSSVGCVKQDEDVRKEHCTCKEQPC